MTKTSLKKNWGIVMRRKKKRRRREHSSNEIIEQGELVEDDWPMKDDWMYFVINRSPSLTTIQLSDLFLGRRSGFISLPLGHFFAFHVYKMAPSLPFPVKIFTSKKNWQYNRVCLFGLVITNVPFQVLASLVPDEVKDRTQNRRPYQLFQSTFKVK